MRVADPVRGVRYPRAIPPRSLVVDRRGIVTPIEVLAPSGNPDSAGPLPPQSRPLAAHCHAGLATLHRRTDRRSAPDEQLSRATSIYGDMGMTY
jgi:hypothetical protein